MLRNILIIVHLVVAVVVASSHSVLLWPLILFGVRLHIE